MKSKAPTVAAYLDSLDAAPPGRRQAIEFVRQFILDHLDPDLHECMQYGVIAYCVPLTRWPHGHHTTSPPNTLPLMYMGLSSQKNDMVVYMLFLLHNQRERAWFDAAWKASGRKSRLEVKGMGCCLRFKRVDDLSLVVIAEAMRRMPVKNYLHDHIAMLANLGREPNGKPLSARPDKSGTQEKLPRSTAKPAPSRKVAKKSASKKTRRTTRPR